MSEKYTNECTEYNETEKTILHDFLEVLKVFYKQSHPTENMIYRAELKKQINQFLSKYLIGNELYFKYPFLWFVCTFFESLKGMLISEKQFIPILLDILREETKLLKECTTLVKIPWEALQYRSNAQIFAFLNNLYENESRILKALHEMLDDGLVALNPRRIISKLKQKIERGNHSYKDLFETFFDLIKPLWVLRFNYSSFDLEEYYCRFKLLKAEELTEILEFSKDSTLNMSLVHQLANSKKEYMGRFIIPKGKYNDFKAYIKEKEENSLINVLSIEKIVNSNETVSYHYYKEGKGWIYNDITELTEDKYLSTGKWNTKWHYSQKKEVKEYIQTFCYGGGENSFSDLQNEIGDLNTKQEKTRLFQEHTTRMMEMYEAGVIKLNLIPRNLVFAFSLDDYVISLPAQQNNEKVSKLLSMLPYAYIYYLEDNSIRIITNLNEELVNLCRSKLGVHCEGIIKVKQQNMPILEVFNERSMNWELNL